MAVPENPIDQAAKEIPQVENQVEGLKVPSLYKEPSMKFISPTEDDPAGYFILTTRRGNELRLNPTNPVMTDLVNQVVENENNAEQAMGPIDLAEHIFDVIQRRGVKIEPGFDHTQAIGYLNKALVEWLKTEQYVKQGKQLKLEEKVLDELAAAVGLSAKDFKRLNLPMQEATADVIQGITLSALSEKITEEVPKTAERLVRTHRMLNERKADLVQHWVKMLGGGLGGFVGSVGSGVLGDGIGGTFEKGYGRITRALDDREKRKSNPQLPAGSESSQG